MVLPMLIYAVETMSLNIKLVIKLQTTQRAIEGVILGINRRDKITIKEIRRRPKLEDVKERIISAT